MTEIKGTNIPSSIVPYDSNDTYPTHDSQYGKGGYHEVETIAERDAIPRERLRPYMACMVKADKVLYILDENYNWYNYLVSVDTGLAQEIADRIAADQALDNKFTAAINKEIQDRTDADDDLQSQLDSEISTRTSEVSRLDGRIDTEASARESADTTLTTNLNKEIQDRETAVSNEASARSSADTTLQNNIDAEAQTRSTEDASIRSDLSAEASARQSADATLTTNLNKEIQDRTDAVSAEASARQSADSALQDNIDAEETARIAADANLQGQVDTINSKISSAASSSNKLTDKKYVDDADNALQTQIDAITSKSDVVDIVGTYAELQAYDTSSLAENDVIKVIRDETRDGAITYYRWVNNAWSYIGEEGPYYTISESDATFATKTDLANETSRAEGAEQTLTTNLNKEISDRQAAITAEASARSSADTTLQSNIDSEASTRSSADTALGTRIDNEISDRQSADSNLQDEISELAGTVDTHIEDTSNPHSVTKAQVGLGNVDNTSDLNKPISTATQTALDTKVDKVSTANRVYGTDSAGAQITYDKEDFGKVDDVKVAGTSVVTNKVANLGSMANETASDYTKTSGLGEVALSNDFEDLDNIPKYGTGVDFANDVLTLKDQDGNALDTTQIKVTPDNVTISRNSSNELQSIGTIEKNKGEVKYDWIGTSAEYNAGDGSTTQTYLAYVNDTETYYVVDSTPTTSSILYAAPHIPSQWRITSIASNTITLSNGTTYTRTSASDVTTTKDIGDLHPTWICLILDDEEDLGPYYTKPEVQSMVTSLQTQITNLQQSIVGVNNSISAINTQFGEIETALDQILASS